MKGLVCCIAVCSLIGVFSLFEKEHETPTLTLTNPLPKIHQPMWCTVRLDDESADFWTIQSIKITNEKEWVYVETRYLSETRAAGIFIGGFDPNKDHVFILTLLSRYPTVPPSRSRLTEELKRNRHIEYSVQFLKKFNLGNLL